jgi:hypothetical protein
LGNYIYRRGKMLLVDEYVANRCEEIVSSDNNCKRMNNEIISICKELRSSLTKEQFDIFLRYDNALSSNQSYIETIIYKQCIRDAAILLNPTKNPTDF